MSGNFGTRKSWMPFAERKLVGLRRPTGIAVLAALLAGFGASAAQAQEVQVINAFAFWRGGGHFTRSGVAQRTFIGVMSGELYIETPQGPVHAGQVTCPGTLRIDSVTASQGGSGSCTFTATDGAQSFADWTCIGIHMVGCRGDLQLTGGTGRFEGISGSGQVNFRADFQGQMSPAGQVADDSAFGIILWRDLRVSLPEAPATGN